MIGNVIASRFSGAAIQEKILDRHGAGASFVSCCAKSQHPVFSQMDSATSLRYAQNDISFI
jgi:hypothetical protein